MKISELPNHVKPREKAKMYGIDYLTNVELLAIVIGNGVDGSSALEISADIISEYDSLASLSRATKAELMQIYGLNEVKALQVLACFALANRIKSEDSLNENSALEPKDLYLRFKSYFDTRNKEELVVVSISRKGKIERINALYRGQDDKLGVSVNEIIKEVMLSGQPSFYLVHNHIDGVLRPSEYDLSLTIKLKEESSKNKINLLDHIILTKESYFSFKENDI